jgi:hypothetical protein
LCQNMIAKLFLVFHDSKVVIITCTKHAVRDNLVLPSSPGDNPNGSAAWLELVSCYFLLVYNRQGWRESFLEDSLEFLFLFFRDGPGLSKLDREIFDHLAFIHFRGPSRTALTKVAVTKIGFESFWPIFQSKVIFSLYEALGMDRE